MDPANLPTNQADSNISLFSSIWSWFVKRGFIFFCIQTPTLAIFLGYFFHLTNYPTAMFAVLIAFMVLPVWIIYRLRVSTDPDEPVHHLAKYALYSLLLAPAFSIVRIPPHFIFGTVFWQPWSDFGSAYSGLPINTFGAFWAGALINFLHGMVLVMGYYILFKRHTLINALLFIFIYFSALYSYAFPFALVGLKINFIWHTIVWWAHLAMAVIAWLMPKFWNKLWPNFNFSARVVTLSLIVIITLFPYLFAYYRAISWQIPKQRSIDQALFSRSNLLKTNGDLKLVRATDGEAYYQYSLQFGSRTYKTYFNGLKALDAGPIQLTGKLNYNGETLAWCSKNLDKLATPNTAWPPDKYSEAIKQMEYTEILIECVGPISIANKLTIGTPVELEWTVKLTLIGDRNQKEQELSGKAQKLLQLE